MKKYICHIDLSPSTLLDGTVYWVLSNQDAKNIMLHKIHLQLGSKAGSANNSSIFMITRVRGVPAGSGSVSLGQYDYSQEKSFSKCMASNSGIDMAGSSILGDGIFTISVRDGQSLPTYDIDFRHHGDDAGFIIMPSDGLCIKAHGAVQAGVQLHGAFEWSEE